MADLGLCRVPVGTHSAASDYHRTAYGVIHISPPWGDLCTIEKWKLKSEKWKGKREEWKVATFNYYSNLINPTQCEVLCGCGQTLFLCVPRERYLVDWYGVACLRHAWGWSLLPHTAHLRCLVWGYWDCMPPARLVMVPVTPHCTPSVFSVGLIGLCASCTLKPSLYKYMTYILSFVLLTIFLPALLPVHYPLTNW